MSKKFAAVMAFVMVSVSFIHAQSTTTPATPVNPGGFIIKGGVNFSNISTQKDGGYSDANTLTTFNVGVLGDIPLASVLSLQPGVVLTGKGAKGATGSFLGANYTSTFNPLYIEVPVNLVVKLPVGGDSRFFFGAGPYGAVGVGGKFKASTTGTVNTSSEENIKFGDSNSDDLKSFDFGLNGLAGIEISRLVLGVNYDLGLTKISPGQTDNDADAKNKYRVFSINVGVRF